MVKWTYSILCVAVALWAILLCFPPYAFSSLDLLGAHANSDEEVV